MQSKYEVVIGLEIHAELLTDSKLFCGCKTDFGGKPNSHCCPVCLALPGALPVINKQAVDLAIRAGLALGSKITPYSKFDRKNYFYPDLPKGYQISQYDLPLCLGGKVSFTLDERNYCCRINRIHLEEEAGKSVHSGDNILGSRYSDMDYNRAGIPLIEIVTEPDLRSPAEAKMFLLELKAILQYLEVSDCKMQEGSLRCDANVSLRPVGSKTLGTKVEVKNLNSFKAVERALDYEIRRQAKAYDNGESIVQETRAWDDNRNVTVSMRSKEQSHDYRYFPEPDLPPLIIDEGWVEEVAKTIPELPQAKRARFQAEYGLSCYEAGVLTSTRAMANYFEATLKHLRNSQAVANWLMGEYLRVLKENGLTIEESPITPESFAELLAIIDEGVISNTQGKEVLSEMFATGRGAKTIVQERGLEQISDLHQLSALADQVLATNPDQVANYRAGKEQLLGFFVGQIMKQTRGKANPKLVNQLLREKLN